MRKNLGLKIVALCVAVVIWIQVALMADHQSRVSLDLKLNDLAPEDSLLAALRKIPCMVQGRGLDIIKLQFSRASIVMNAADLRERNYKAFEAVNLPANLNLAIVSIDPAYSPRLQGLAGEPDGEGVPVRKGKKDTPPRPELPDPADPLNTLVLTNIPISGPPELRYFPAVVTIKVRGKSSHLASLPKGISVTVSGNPDARGLYSLTAQTPEGVTLQDITPKQVRLWK